MLWRYPLVSRRYEHYRCVYLGRNNHIAVVVIRIDRIYDNNRAVELISHIVFSVMGSTHLRAVFFCASICFLFQGATMSHYQPDDTNISIEIHSWEKVSLHKQV